MSARTLPARAASLVVAVLFAGSVGAGTAYGEDPYEAEQWSLDAIGAQAARSHSTGEGVVVGIVDSGVDATHPDLASKIDALATCFDGVCKSGSAPDGDGHGTGVAGVIAAAAGNGAGVAGVAPGARLVVARALGDDGVGRTEDIIAAILWVVDEGAQVVNLSLGATDLVITSRLGTPLASAIEYAWSRGAIPVLAAGNYEPGDFEPGITGQSANYGDLHAVVVGATDAAGAVAAYSTSLGDAQWGVVAPGGSGGGEGADILTTTLGGWYSWMAGTSLAAPHVSGTLALLLAQDLSPQQAVDRLLSTLDRSAPCGEGCQGRVRADAAVQPPIAAASAPIPVTPIPVTEVAGPIGPQAVALAVTFLLVVVSAHGWAWALRSRRDATGAADWLATELGTGATDPHSF